jgi:hypothetical protein
MVGMTWTSPLIRVENENPTEVIDSIVHDLGVKCAGVSGRALLFVPLSKNAKLPKDILDRIEERLSGSDSRRVLSEFPYIKAVRLINS